MIVPYPVEFMLNELERLGNSLKTEEYKSLKEQDDIRWKMKQLKAAVEILKTVSTQYEAIREVVTV